MAERDLLVRDETHTSTVAVTITDIRGNMSDEVVRAIEQIPMAEVTHADD